jgi:cellulose synthase/poly-beta-1,6-N-acetylglucosamine synthase-like glycosyltransferase
MLNLCECCVIVLSLLVIPYFVLMIVTALVATFRRQKTLSVNSTLSRFLIVCPAHDEEFNVSTTVESCLVADYPPSQFEVLVIADNCSDRTATVAARSGARVLERFDPERKSKGYALEFLLDHLESTGGLGSLDAIVVIDADTIMDSNLLRYFDQDLQRGRDWIQCYYTLANPDESWRTRLMMIGFSLHNGVMPLARDALGIGAGLRGNGMCFSTRGLRRVPWRAHGLVEDLEFTWTLLIAGEQIAFQPRACVRGIVPSLGGSASANQRRRWEFGRREVKRKFLGPLLRSKSLSLGRKAALVCVLTMPTVATLAVISVLVAALDLYVWLGVNTSSDFTPAMAWVPLLSILIMASAWGLYLISPFVCMALKWKYAKSLVFAPVYVCWKSIVALTGRPKQWVRTRRR